MHPQSCFLSYVLDTNAIINLYSLELRGEKILDKLSKQSKIYLPDKVREELFNVIRREGIDHEVYNYILSKPYIKKVPNSKFDQCIRFVRDWVKSIHGYNPLDEGELYCLALSLFLSRKNRSFIIMIT